MRNLVLIILFFQISGASFAQVIATDSTRLSLESVLAMAKQYHPLLKQADLQGGFAEAEIRTARGLMDPKITASYDQKVLKDEEYFDLFKGALKIPTWFPLEPKVEVYRNQGTRLNDQNYISPSTNYWQVVPGVSLALGKGLIIDERRSAIRQAELYTDLAEAEQIKLSNKAILSIIKDYWEWYFAYEQYKLMLQSIDIADEIFRRVKLDYEYGEAAPVDTIQALITLQSREVDFQKAQLELRQKMLQMNVHIWGPDNVPLEIDSTIAPSYSDDFGIVPTENAIIALVAWANENHPEVLKLTTKIEQLEIEERWNRESLKPEINLKYSLIDAPIYYNGFNEPDFNSSYKFGVDFAFPLFLRKERGKLQKTRLYIQSTDYDLILARQEISIEILQTYAELKTSEQLAKQYRLMAINYQRLLDAEVFNLNSGESDLFKLNIQQDKFIESQRKYYDADLKFQKLKATLPQVIGLQELSYSDLF